MILNISKSGDKFVEKIYRDSMKSLNSFYEFKLKNNVPVILVENRQEIDVLYGSKTEKWIVGWGDRNKIFLLNRKNYEKESNHKYSDEEYAALIKHELSHCFFQELTKGPNPRWLDEGLSIYLSGQLKFKKFVEKFSNVLNYYNKIDGSVYNESGFFVKFLAKKYGKEKLLKLIKALPDIHSENDFNQLFKRVYQFNLNYKTINSIYKK